MIAVEDGLWTVRDVAKYLQVSRSWVYQRVESGLLPCLYIGACVRFDPGAIRAYAMSGGKAPKSAFNIITKGT